VPSTLQSILTVQKHPIMLLDNANWYRLILLFQCIIFIKTLVCCKKIF